MTDLRRVLHSAYTFVRSIEANKAVASLTLDHMIQEQINKLKKGQTRALLDSQGNSIGDRVSYLDSLDVLEKEMQDVVTALQNAGTDPEKLQELGIFEVDQSSTQSGNST